MAPDYAQIVKENGGIEGYLKYVRSEYTRPLVIKDILGANQYPEPSILGPLVRDLRLTDLLLKATSPQSFERVCLYLEDFLSNPDPADALAQSPTDQEYISSLRAAFKKDYIGNAAVDCLHEYITDCDKKFYNANPKYYGRFCSIVQSSGAGKSRTLIELMKKKVLGLYMNVRLPGDVRTYPLRDDVPANILTTYVGTSDEYWHRCCAFFTAVFIVLRQWLNDMGAGRISSEELIAAWSAVICDLESTRRSEFFSNVDDQYTTSIESNRPLRALLDAYGSLVHQFPTFFRKNSHYPRLVIAIDEAHHLGEERNMFRPSDILCQVISEFSYSEDVSNWVIFVSTTSRVADFSVPAPPIRSSHRISQGGEGLFPPYSLCDWDQMAKPPGDADPWKVGHFSNVVGFGRPLWSSLADAGISFESVMETAREKLCGTLPFEPNDLNHVLAVLGQRLCLDIRFGHRKAVSVQIDAVASHLRVSSETTDDRSWQTTFYPSEPLLSCAASEVLHHQNGDHTTLAIAFESLGRMIKNGLIEMDQKGNLASGILFLIGKDLCVRTPSFPLLQPLELDDCKPLRVVDYLRFLFGETAISQVANDHDTETVESVFQDWYVNFSHWIPMSGTISFPESDPESQEDDLTEWLAHHWFRTCAVQCSSYQETIDKLIPMFKLEPKQQSTSPTESYSGGVSFILISDQASPESARTHLDTITPGNLNISDLSQPYIAIQADLQAKDPKLELTLTRDDSATQNLRVYAAGINAKTYNFLHPSTMQRTQEALQQTVTVSRGSPNISLLKDRVLWGSTSEVHHMRWELKG